MNISPKEILNTAKEDCQDFKAMVCVSIERQNEIVNKLLALNCKVYIPKSETDAIEKLRYNSFHIIVFEDDYSVEAIQILQNFPMSVRRYTFFVLIGELIETANMMQSFVLNCNLIVNIEHLADFSNILTDAIKENQLFFKPLTDSFEKMYLK